MPRPLEELEFRRALCQECIKVVDQTDNSDPRKKGAMEEYKAQLATIDAEIAEITGKPPPVVVGLKTATLFGKSELSRKVKDG